MRSEYSAHLRRAFAEALTERFPEFTEINVLSDLSYVGERVFRWVPREGLHCFIMLVPSQDGRDAFTVELGWSRRGRFPEWIARPFGPPTDARVEFARDEYIIRLAALWNRLDPWWSYVDPQASDDVEAFLEAALVSCDDLARLRVRAALDPLIADALAHLESHGIPYLREFAGAAAKSA